MRERIVLPVFQVDWKGVNGSRDPGPLVSEHVSPWELRLRTRSADSVWLRKEEHPSHHHGKAVTDEATSTSQGQGLLRMQLVHEASSVSHQREASRLLRSMEAHAERLGSGDHQPEDSQVVFEWQVPVSWCVDHHNTTVMQAAHGSCPPGNTREFLTQGLTSRRKLSHGSQDPSFREEDDLRLSLSL